MLLLVFTLALIRSFALVEMTDWWSSGRSDRRLCRRCAKLLFRISHNIYFTISSVAREYNCSNQIVRMLSI